MAEPDLLIVGGGPAGLFGAIAARTRGLSAQVIDARKPPLDKACGEGLMPDGAALLREHGVVLPQHRPFKGISYHQGAIEVAGAFPEGYSGAGIRRVRLHEALLRRAQELGVEVHWGAKATALLADPAGKRAGVSTAEGARWGRWLVGADGLHSKIRAWANLAGPETDWQRFGVRRHFAVAPWSDKVEVHWGPQAEAYVTPVGEAEIGVAFLWSGRKSSFDALLQSFPALAARLAGAVATSKDRGAGPLEQRAKAVTQGRVLLLGDAAGYLDAITGEGLSLAFHQGAALAEALAAGKPQNYAAACRDIVRWPERLTRLTLELERRPALRARVLRAFAADPAFFERFLAVHCRASSPARLFAPLFLARMMGRLVFLP